MSQERIAFENWLGIKPCGAAHDLAWAAWKARASLPAPQQATPEPVGEVVYIAKGHLREVLNGNTMNAYLSPEPDRFADVALSTHRAPGVPEGFALVQSPITEAMHEAACKVLTRATGLDGLPQRMLDALAAAQAKGGEHG